MGAIEEHHIYGLQVRESADDGSDFANPDADYRLVFLGEDGKLHAKDSSGTVTSLGGTGLVDPMTTRGDIIIRDSSNATARLAKGSAGRVLTSDGTDVAWGNGPLTTKGDLIVGGASGALSRLGVGTDGHVLTLDSGQSLGVKWAAASGGSSDTRPYLSRLALHGTYGDDFTGASLDAKWTQRGSATHVFQDGDATWLRMVHSTGGSELIRQNAPAGDFEIVVAFSLYHSSLTNNNMVGPFIVDSSGNGVMCTHYWNANNPFLGVLSTWGYSSAPVTLSGATTEYAWMAPLWMGLKKSGTNYSFRYSHNGEVWSPYSSTSSQSFTPAYIGFGRHNGGTANDISTIDVFNVI